MNQKQKEYAINRVNTIYENKKNQIEDKHTTEAVSLDGPDKFNLIKKGQAPLRKSFGGGYRQSPYLDDVFDFSKFERNRKIDHRKIGKELSPLRIELSKVKDTIMLGEEAEALNLLKNFELACK